ncbi:MAG TPA: polyprenyl synthetase family protein [Rhabdochlamydiaceae bacterium]|jgi:geranylgeranyl diphosphate synthase type II
MHLEAFLHSAQPLLEERLHALIPSDTQLPFGGLFAAARYSLFSGGKRLRPLLVLASCLTVEGTLQKALDPACAIECIHTYSLIHDDLPCMDNDDMRRGKPTLHCVYPEWHALLTGDYLLTFAFEILAQSPYLSDAEKIACIQLIAANCGARGMIGGQMIDLHTESMQIDKALLEQMHSAKTAALFSAALECGAIAAGASPRERSLLRECGEKIGLAFQIADDIFDAPSSDQKNNKATAVSLLGYAEAMRCKEALLNESLSILNSLSQSTFLLSSFFEKILKTS